MPLDEAMADGLRFYGEVIATLQKNGPLPDEKQRPNFKDDDNSRTETDKEETLEESS